MAVMAGMLEQWTIILEGILLSKRNWEAENTVSLLLLTMVLMEGTIKTYMAGQNATVFIENLIKMEERDITEQ